MADKKGLFGRFTLADVGLRPKVQRPDAGPLVLIAQLGAVGLLLVRTFRYMITAKTDSRDTARMAFRYTNESVSFVVLAMSFVGMIMVYQSTIQLTRSIGDINLVGATFIKILLRVLGPTVIGMLIACRVGAGIAAEIGAMAVTDQLDAMRMCAADPIEVLMVPRVRAGIVASLVLVIIGSAAAAVAGLATGMILFSMSANTYWNFTLVGPADIVQGLVKAAIYGVAIPIIAGMCGLSARGGARGVGQATTNAVVGCSFAIVVLDSLVSLSSHVMVGG